MKSINLLVSAVACIALATGCASDKPVVITPDEGGKREVVTTGIDPTDFKRVADAIQQRIGASGVLQKLQDGSLPLVAVSTVINNTSQRINAADLTGAIMTSLQEGNHSRVMLNIGIGADGQPILQDRTGKANNDIDVFTKGTKVMRRPDFTLSGTIDETYTRQGNARQYSYKVQMRLARGNDTVWQGQEEIKKGVGVK
ncbi:MAG: hypothetical protein HYR88_05330 [Verrucomicrobia bacterium]|nr:hypothetical protein [Verrucomicrobiota bacterium]